MAHARPDRGRCERSVRRRHRRIAGGLQGLLHALHGVAGPEAVLRGGYMIREEFSMPQAAAQSKGRSSWDRGRYLVGRGRTWLLRLLLVVALVVAGLVCVRMIEASGLKAKVLADIAGVHADESSTYSLLKGPRGDSVRSRSSVAVCQKLVELRPNDADARVKLGDAYAEMERTKEAMASYQEALALDPNSFDAHLGLGKAYFGQGSYDEAIVSYRKALKIRPRSADAQLALGLALSNVGKYDEAMQAFQKAKELDPTIVETQVMTGKAYFQAGMYAQAIETLKDAVETDQEHAQAYFNLGCAYLRVGDKGLALEQQHVLENLDPRLANRLLNMINQ
jgi:tetratricopeptide (TPR) repeat protein